MWFPSFSSVTYLLWILHVAHAVPPPSTNIPVKCRKILNSIPTIISAATKNDIKLSTYSNDVGTKVNVSCLAEGYGVCGATTLTCQASGEWSETVPTSCAPSCGKEQVQKSKTLVLGLSIGLSIFGVLVLLGAVIAIKRRRSKLTKNNVERRLNAGEHNKMYSEEMTRYSEQDTCLTQPPSVYKVWSHDRSVRKFISAYGYEELKKKGGKTFSIMNPKLVLEEDGTEIEDNIALEACKNKTLLILAKQNTWYKDSQISIHSDGVLDIRESLHFDAGTVRSYHL